jgi:hypothetical protein
MQTDGAPPPANPDLNGKLQRFVSANYELEDKDFLLSYCRIFFLAPQKKNEPIYQ